ncbi:N-acetylmuramoyl-L-alanine amidase family protein [Gordoniibacillus kamchatkensis]|uniref:N-acetylmuramoyl-L-alanine amidase family protein n=1 Tax=Gordoniibacillus kamchatkensis TaxID=1590651 RepID=UPI0009E4EC55|nr:N-acetylmuramoyl-L-alanine amidase [Paenibacillus sp. VKM B-2647]
MNDDKRLTPSSRQARLPITYKQGHIAPLYKLLYCLLACWLTVLSFAVPVAAAPAEIYLPNPDVVIDAGHGGVDGGASHGPWLEKDLNLALAKSLYRSLAAKHLIVALNRTGDYALSDDNRWLRIPSRHKRDLAQRTGLANELRPKLLVSLHLNTSSDPRQSGPVVLHQRDTSSRLAAALIQQSLNRVYGTNSRAPAVGRTYYVLNHAACPAVIVELGYLTNASDRSRLTTSHEQQRIVQALAEGIGQYLLIERVLGR